VAHGAHRVADFVRDAGRQPAEARELGLLDLGRQQLGVLEKGDDGRRLGAAQRAKCGWMTVAAIGGDESLRRRAGGAGAGTPGFQ
jgi:hypothetical protein